MKDTKTHRAVKNILHNELGITYEKVEQLITEYVDKQLDKRVNTFMQTKIFEHFVQKKVEESINPIIKEALRDRLKWINISVNFDSDKK